MTPFSPKANVKQRQQALATFIETLKADTKPILIGPWRSELGFETMYWLPFLRRLAKAVPKFDQRAAVVTRGGLAPLYKAVASQGYDLYAMRSVTEVRRENLHDHQVTKLLKQLKPTAWDDDVLAEAADHLQLGSLYHVLHPAWMYWCLEPFWNEDVGLRYLAGACDFTPLEKPTLDGHLPPRYVAVKFYARHTFPYPHPEVAEFVQRTVSQIASQAEIVVLNSGPEYDDHADIPFSGPNIHRLPEDLPAEQNLITQTAVLAHATAFIGTYGGMAQLALRMGVPSTSFWFDWSGTAHGHLNLSSWLAKESRTPFLASSVSEAEIWKQVVGGVTVTKREVVAA